MKVKRSVKKSVLLVSLACFLQAIILKPVIIPQVFTMYQALY